MSEKLLERCTICCGDVYYTAVDAFVTCPACGNTQAVAAFQREKNKLQETLRQGKQAQEALADAQQEKQEAQERLNKAVTALGSMDARLYDISAQLGEDREAFEQLLSGLQGGQNALLQRCAERTAWKRSCRTCRTRCSFCSIWGWATSSS